MSRTLVQINKEYGDLLYERNGPDKPTEDRTLEIDERLNEIEEEIRELRRCL